MSGGPDGGHGGAAMCGIGLEVTLWLVAPAPPRHCYWTAQSAAATHSKSPGASLADMSLLASPVQHTHKTSSLTVSYLKTLRERVFDVLRKYDKT